MTRPSLERMTGKLRSAVADEASVIDDLAAGDRFCGVAVPVGLVEFADGGDWHTLSRQSARRVRRDGERSRHGDPGVIGGNDIGRAFFSWLDSKLGFDAI